MTERLDSATLEWVADTLATGASMEPQDAEERGAAKALRIIADGLRERAADLAAEAASRPPTLGAWFMAMCDSRLGEPWLTQPYGARWRHDVGEIRHKPGIAEVHAHIVTPSQRLRFARVETLDDEGARTSVVECDTPTALQAALDAIADEVPHG